MGLVAYEKTGKGARYSGRYPWLHHLVTKDCSLKNRPLERQGSRKILRIRICSRSTYWKLHNLNILMMYYRSSINGRFIQLGIAVIVDSTQIRITRLSSVARF